MSNQEEKSEKMRYDETYSIDRAKRYEMYAKIIPVALISGVLIFAIQGYYDLEQNKLDLARHQFDVQAEQSDYSLKLQAAQQNVKALEIVMNSPVVETTVANLIKAPHIAANTATDLVGKLIERFDINVDLSAQLGNKDGTNAKTIPIESNGITNTSKNTSNIVKTNVSIST